MERHEAWRWETWRWDEAWRPQGSPCFVGQARFVKGTKLLDGGKSLSNSKYDPDRNTRFTRNSLRLKGYNYGWSGTYFITIRAAGCEWLFENPVLHGILERQWYALPRRFPSLTLDEFVIMPNHVHCIVKLEGNVEKPTTLGRVVGAYKSLAAVEWLHYIKEPGIAGLELPGHIWERDFYDHVIQNTREFGTKKALHSRYPQALERTIWNRRKVIRRGARWLGALSWRPPGSPLPYTKTCRRCNVV